MSINVCNLGLVVAAALLLDCAQTRSPLPSGNEHPVSGAAGEGAAPPARASCEDYQTEAHELLDAAVQCSRDEDCVIAGIEGMCLWPFLCPTPVNRMAVGQLQSEARRISAAYRSCSNVCAIASCVYRDGVSAVCNATSKRCEAPSPAARMPDVGSDFPDASTEGSDET